MRQAVTMETGIQPVRLYRYILMPAFWQGRTAYLLRTPREDNPCTDPADRLAWLLGWDEEAEDDRAFQQVFQCNGIHAWDVDEAGEYCIVCGIRKP